MATSKDRGISPGGARAPFPAVLQRWATALSGRGDLVLAALIVAVIAMLVLPLPTFLLDALIATNLAASVALLMLSLYIGSPLGLSTFPSLLLLTTLFRLSLNIASTKLILLNGEAGHVIDTFGRLVVGGNVVVGLVVFLIIAIVQFIVIAKGAERVAEVGARFSLDGMPGKQMSIDADLRAGLIDKEEAQRRRREVEDESRLHGAMDGAMKFVKGDAIAGIIIAFVNIIAGIAIGTSMHGMPIGEAIETYSVLSVGDGMVAQIPSLFVSIAAGILITRVDGKLRGRNNLGMQITQEVLGQPPALLMAGGIVATFLLLRGLPVWPFLTLALLLFGAGYVARKRRGHRGTIERSALRMPESGAPGDGVAPPVAVPLRLRLAASLRSQLQPAAFDRVLDREKAALLDDIGLQFPDLSVTFDNTLVSGHYAIDVQEVPVAQGNLDAPNVASLNADRATAPAPASASREERLVSHLLWCVRRQADSFVGMQEVHTLLARAATQLPELTAEAQRLVPLQRIAEVLRRLVQEEVSIRYLREICESLIVWGPREKDIVMLTEYVRIDLGRFIVPRYLDSKGALRAVVLGSDAEKTIRDAIQQGAGGSFLALDPADSASLVAGAESALSGSRSDGPQIVLAPMDVRRYLKKILAARLPSLVVLSYQELPAHVQIQTVATLGLLSTSHRRLA